MVANQNTSTAKLFKKGLLIFCLGLLTFSQPIAPGSAQMLALPPQSAGNVSEKFEVVYDREEVLGHQLRMPLYIWRAANIKPKGVVLAVHGLGMHGRVYEKLGRSLAEKGYMLVSTDLHGYGSYVGSIHKYCEAAHNTCKEKTNYGKSYEDLATLAQCLKVSYPDSPLFAVGESLGGALVIRMAGTQPELFDGLILSAPALRHHTFLDGYLMVDAGLLMTNPRHKLDLTPFIRRYSSDDPRIVEEVLADPITRKHMSAYELCQVSAQVHKTIAFVSNIPQQTAVLVIQGSADKCVKAEAVMLLLSQLRSSDQTVRWFPNRGHILIETAYIKPDTLDSVVDWLENHVGSADLQAKYKHSGLVADAEQHRAIDLTVSGVLNPDNTYPLNR